jgi:hypothetical protein
VKLSSDLPRWGVYLLRKKAERLGRVEAEDEVEAMARAFEQFDIGEVERWRVSVQKEA